MLSPGYLLVRGELNAKAAEENVEQFREFVDQRVDPMVAKMTICTTRANDMAVRLEAMGNSLKELVKHLRLSDGPSRQCVGKQSAVVHSAHSSRCRQAVGSAGLPDSFSSHGGQPG